MAKKRSQPTGKETAVSLAVLLLPVFVGTVIFLIKDDYNPAVSALQQRGLYDSSRIRQTKKESGLVIPIPDDITPLSDAEGFDPDTLFVKIDGKAELYLSAGFVYLQTRRLAQKDDPSRWYEVYVYDMLNASNAFAVFSQQRRDDATPPVDLTDNAYSTSNALYLTHGKYYLEIVAAQADESLRQSLLRFAALFIKATLLDAKAAQKPATDEFSFFPQEGLVPDEKTIIPANAFGFSRLDKVYAVVYRIEAAEMTAYITKRKDAAEAQGLLSGFKEFLVSFGGNSIRTEISNASFELFELFGTYEICFTQGRFFAGIHEAENKENAIDLAVRLQKRLAEVPQ